MRYGTGRLSEREIRNAYVLYRRGYSLREIAGLLWERYGYSSPEACRSSLRVAFRCRLLFRRSRSDAMKLYHEKRRAA